MYTDETVNNPDQQGNASLHNAVFQNDEEMLSNLLQHGCIDLNLTNHLGFTPFLLAIKRNQPYSYIMQFVHTGADLNATHELGRNYLHMALICCNDEIKLLHELIKNGVNINAQDHLKRTPLHYAVEADNMEAVCMLLYYAADVSILDNRNRNPFCVAIFHNKIKIAEVLFDYYDDFSDADCDGYTALHFAIEGKHPIAFDLIKSGADVNCITYDNKNSLKMCLYTGRNIELFELIWSKFNYHLLLNAEIPFLYGFMLSSHFDASSACAWLKAMYLVLNCPVLFELLDHYRKYSARYYYYYSYYMFNNILPVFSELNIKLCDRLNIISILLSLGTEIGVRDINLVLILYGFNEELEMFLYCTDYHARHDFACYTLLPQCSFIFSTDDPNIKTVIKLFIYFVEDVGFYSRSCKEPENCIFTNLRFFSIPSDLKAELIDHFRYRVPFEDYTPAVIDKINGLPEFPSLVELSRNQARKCIMQTFKITKAYQFHDIVKKLKLPNLIRDILRFKTPLY